MERRTLMPLLLIPLLLSLADLADASCYFPDGSLSLNDRPCTDKTQDSVCCGQGYACLSNGICQATGDELKKPGASKYVRGSCTDKDWRSSDCPLFCIDPNQDLLSGGMGIFKCSNTTKDLYLCIDKGNIDSLTPDGCEKNSNALFFPGAPTIMTTIGVRAPSSSSSTSSTSSTSTTMSTSTTTRPPESTSSAMPPPSETPKVHGSNSSSSSATASPTQTPVDSSPPAKTPNGAVIGGAVGGALGGVAVIGIVAWLLVSRRRAGKQEHEEQQEQQLTRPVFEADSTDMFEMVKNPTAHGFSATVHEAPGWTAGQRPPHYHPHEEIHEVE